MQPEHFPQGMPFGRYVIQRHLGSGTFGAVYAASHQDLHRKVVALKVLHRHLLHLQEAVRRFQNEAQIIAELRHPHIVEVLDVGRHDGIPFMAMEFLEGETLAQQLEREGRMDLRSALEVLLPICSAVMTVHAAGIVHRDLKPENFVIVRSRPGRVHPKLLDFGVAKERVGQAGMTRTGASMGTPYYMSPEQVEEARDADGASDQWSLAVILFHCITGKLPFEGRSTVAVMHKIVTEPPLPPSALNPSCPPALDDVILRALSKSPRERHHDVRAFAAALLPFASPRTRMEWAEEFASGFAVDAEAATRTNISLPPQRPYDTEPVAHVAPTLVSEQGTPLPTVPLAAFPTEPSPRDAAPEPPPTLSTMSLGVQELSTLPDAAAAIAPRRPPSRWILPVAFGVTIVLSISAGWTVLVRHDPRPVVVHNLASQPAPIPAAVVGSRAPAVLQPAPVTRPALPSTPPPAPMRAAPVTSAAPPRIVVAAPSRAAPSTRPARAASSRAPSIAPRSTHGQHVAQPTQSWPPPLATPPGDTTSHTNSGLRVRF